MSKKAVVTGCAGYIGLVLCKMLKEQGYYVIGVDNAVPASATAKRFNLVKKYTDQFLNKDFCEDEFLDKFIHSDYTIYHLAAHSLLGRSIEEPIEYFLNNAVKTLKLFDFALKRNVAKFIFASTAAVYSEVQEKRGAFYWPGTLTQMYRPVAEDEIIAPPNNYGMSKLHVENYFDAFVKHHKWATDRYMTYYVHGKPKDMQIFSFRFFNVVGGYGEVGPLKHTPHIVSSLIRALQDDETFFFNGDDFKTKDGTCIRDYVDVKDVCRAMMHVDNWAPLTPEENKVHYKFNLGTGKGYSNKEVVAAFSRVVSPHVDQQVVKTKVGPRRPGDPPYLVADPQLFIESTGFTYKYSDDLDKMIESAWSAYNV